jgi:hypothetical protein
MATGALPFTKFFAEKIDLIREMNTIIFLHQVVSTFSEISLNTIGTRPAENICGLLRVAANGNHSQDRCKGTVTKASLVNEIMFVCRLKSHVRRDFSIAGVKVFRNDDRENFQIPGFGDRGFACPEKISDFFDNPQLCQPPECFADWMHDPENLTEWKNLCHGMKSYSPSPVTNETQVSRIISYSSDRDQGQFRWTKSRKQKALQWHDDPRFSIELITSKLGREPEDVQMMLRQWATNCETIEEKKES